MGWGQVAGCEKNVDGSKYDAFITRIFTRAYARACVLPRESAALGGDDQVHMGPKASAIREKNAKEAGKPPRERTGRAKPASPSSRCWRLVVVADALRLQ